MEPGLSYTFRLYAKPSWIGLQVTNSGNGVCYLPRVPILDDNVVIFRIAQSQGDDRLGCRVFSLFTSFSVGCYSFIFLYKHQLSYSIFYASSCTPVRDYTRAE